MDWKTRKSKFSKSNEIDSVTEYNDLCSKNADICNFEKEYISCFEAKVLSVIPEWDIEHLQQYVQFKSRPHYKEPLVRHPKLAWRLKLIDFSRYCKDSYGHSSKDIAARLWLSKQDIVTAKQIDWLRKKTIKFPTPLNSFCIKFKTHWYRFDESIFTKKEMLSKQSILYKAVQVLLRDKINNEIDKRRYHQWDC